MPRADGAGQPLPATGGTARSPLSLRAGVACFAISMLAAVVVYGIGHRLPAVYASSGTIRVATVTQNGIADSNVTAENDLASQYAQLVSSSSVVTMTAKALGVPPSELSGKINGSTLGAQNILAVTVSASTPAAAVLRAQAAVHAVAGYLTQLTAQFDTAYATILQSRVRDTSIPGDTASHIAPQVLAAYANARATALFEALRDAAGNQPSFQIINPGGGASQTAPKPKLYALVAFIVALLLSLRVALVTRSPTTR